MICVSRAYPDEFRDQSDAGGVAENFGVDLVTPEPFIAIGELDRMFADHWYAKLEQ